jgi:hypothetical protein
VVAVEVVVTQAQVKAVVVLEDFVQQLLQLAAVVL